MDAATTAEERRPRVSLGSLPTELHALIARIVYLDAIPTGSLCTLDPLALPSPNPLADGSDPLHARPLASTHTETRKTLYALCLTSRSFYVAARPLLFRHVIITLPYSFVLVLRTLGAAHLAQVYDKYAASGNQDFLLRDPVVVTPQPQPSQPSLPAPPAGTDAQAAATLVKRKRDRTVTFEEMVAAAGFAHAAGGTLVIKAKSKAALERTSASASQQAGRTSTQALQQAGAEESGAAATAATLASPQFRTHGSVFASSEGGENEMDLVWIEDPTSKSKSKRYHVHLAPFKPTALTLSNEELFAAHRFVRVIDFSRYTSQGMRRSVGDTSKNRFVTPAKLLALITAVSEFLESFGASETMDSALTCEILEALLFRDGEWAKPSHLRGVSIERRRSVSRHRGTSLTRDADQRMLRSLDLCNCVSPRFGEALTRFVQLYLRPRAVGIRAADFEPPQGPLEMHAEEDDVLTTSTETETETEAEADTDAEGERGRSPYVQGGGGGGYGRGRQIGQVEEEEDDDGGDTDEEVGRGRDTRSRRIFGSKGGGSNSRSRSRTPFAGASSAAGAGGLAAPPGASSSSSSSSSSTTQRPSSLSRTAGPSMGAAVGAGTGAGAGAGASGSSTRLASPMVRHASLTRSASKTRSRSTAFTPATFPSLRRLGLNGITFPVDIVAPFVLAFPHLTHLDLSRTKVDGALLRALAGSDSLALQSLSLARCRSIDSESILELVVRSDVCAGLVELNLEGTLIFPAPLTREDAMTLIKEAPAIRSGAMRYLDLSGCGLTDAHLDAFGPQPSLLDVGLGCNPRLTLRGVATFLRERAPNVQVLDLQDSCTAGGGDAGWAEDEDVDMADGPPIYGTAGGGAVTAVQLHQQLLAPCCLPPPIPLSQQLAAMGFRHHVEDDGAGGGGAEATATAATGPQAPPRPPTNLRVIELGATSLRSVRNGIDTWKVVWGAGQRGWIVDMAAGPNPQAVFEAAAEEEKKDRARQDRGRDRHRGRASHVGALASDYRSLSRGPAGPHHHHHHHHHDVAHSRSRSRARSTSRVRAPGRTVSLDTDDELRTDEDEGDEAEAEADNQAYVAALRGRGRGRGGYGEASSPPRTFGRAPSVHMLVDEDEAGDSTMTSVDPAAAAAAAAAAAPLVARNEVVRSLPASHPRRMALEALGRAKGHVSGDTGWHSRKMEILLGFGFMGREAGSYASVAYQT